jgi:RNA polymerase sigma-70 factor (ECF subfamily)
MQWAEYDSAETRDLLEQVRAGDTSAVERLFEQHRDFIRQVVKRRIDARINARIDPSDVVQEVQLEAFRRLPDFLKREPMPFRSWLLKTAYQRMLKVQRYHLTAERRSNKREVSLPDRSSLFLARQLIASGTTASRTFERRELVSRIRHVLSELSEMDREIVLLRTLEALSNDEAACLLDIEPATAKKRYTRALLRLNRQLKERGIRESQL